MILNFHVDDFDAVEAQLHAAGVDWLGPVADRPFGRFASLITYLPPRSRRRDLEYDHFYHASARVWSGSCLERPTTRRFAPSPAP
jgi:hypothetical protein